VTEPAGLRRLDPRSVVSRLLSLSAIRQRWGVLIAVLAGFGVSGRLRLVTAILGIAVVIAVTVGAALIDWLRFEYGIADGRLVVRRGLVRRSLTVVPLDRIRGVDVHSSAVQRVLGIAVLRVDAAATGGRHDEAVLDAVSGAEAARLRLVLLREAPAAHEPAEPHGPGGSTLATLRPSWLLYAPLVGSYLVAPVGLVFALQQYLDDLHLPWFDRVADAINRSRFGPLEIAGLAAAGLAVCAIGAVATAAVGNWGFTLARRGGSLVSERGLLSRRQVSLEVARIRGWSLAEPASLRLVGAARLTALVTGLGGENTRRGQLLPLGPASVARAVARQILPFGGELRRHPGAARRRRLLRATLPWLLLAAVALGLGWWWAAVPLAGLAVLGVPLALDRYRGLGHGLDDRAIAVRSGSLRRREAVLERKGVVGWKVRQSFFQRRAGLATLTVGTGAGGFEIIDLAAADAAGVLHAVSPRQTAGLAAGGAGGPGDAPLRPATGR
jgi:uncharacterized membrane protein YdbT with pleckstrin-like domain